MDLHRSGMRPAPQPAKKSKRKLKFPSKNIFPRSGLWEWSSDFGEESTRLCQSMGIISEKDNRPRRPTRINLNEKRRIASTFAKNRLSPGINLPRRPTNMNSSSSHGHMRKRAHSVVVPENMNIKAPISGGRQKWGKVSTTYRQRIIELAASGNCSVPPMIKENASGVSVNGGFVALDYDDDSDSMGDGDGNDDDESNNGANRTRPKETDAIEKEFKRLMNCRKESSKADFLSEDSRKQFFNLYHQTSETKARPESTRGRYIQHCEKVSLLPLPVLDFASRSGKTRYDDPSGKLNYSNYYFGDNRANALASALESLPLHVRELSLKNTGISGSGSSAIMTSIAENNVTVLDFSQNRIGLKGASKLADLLALSSNQIKHLNLSHNQLGDQAVTVLMRSLQERCLLETLDLSGNKIFQSAICISEFMKLPTTLKKLDLAWNQIRADPAIILAQSIKENSSLTHLNLADNSFGNGELSGRELATSLTDNTKLEYLDLSNNHLRGKSTLLIIDSIQQNKSLKKLLLNGNPIGCAASALISRLVAICSIKCEVIISDCSLEIEYSELVHLMECGGAHKLNLADLYDRLFAKHLVFSYCAGKGDFLSIKYGKETLHFEKFCPGGPSNMKQHLTKQFKYLPTTGILEVTFLQCDDSSSAESITNEGFQHTLEFLDNSFQNDDLRTASMIRILAGEFTFSVQQANILLGKCRAEKAEVAAALLPQLSDYFVEEHVVMDGESSLPHIFFEDKDGNGKIDVCGDICVVMGLDHLTDLEQKQVEERIGKWITFNPKNPNGVYRLNLANKIDRLIMVKLLELNHADRNFRMLNKLPDTSENGNFFSFRNVRYNHRRVVIDMEWLIPREGYLEFDFSSTRRPGANCVGLNDVAFERFFKEFKNLDVCASDKIHGLRAVSSKYFFTARQLQRVMEFFDPYEKYDNREFLRVELFVTLFSRIVDETNLNVAFDILTEDNKKRLRSRLGHANVFNPLNPDGVYELNLEVYDQRYTASMLMTLVQTKEGKFSKVSLDNKALEIPNAWFENLPPKGILRGCFQTTNRVNTFHQLPQNCYRRKLTQLLVFKE